MLRVYLFWADWANYQSNWLYESAFIFKIFKLSPIKTEYFTVENHECDFKGYENRKGIEKGASNFWESSD